MFQTFLNVRKKNEKGRKKDKKDDVTSGGPHVVAKMF